VKCNKLIEDIYKNPKVTELLSKIEPVDLQDDLRQELALTLLNYDCDKLLKIDKEGNLINYALKTLWNIGTFKECNFNKIYKKRDTQITEYIRSQQGHEIPLSKAIKAKSILTKKLDIDANNAHEAILFNKYVELRSYQKVADYFKIPRLHVMRVINTTKKELKQKLYD
jgi:hypothetical protein